MIKSARYLGQLKRINSVRKASTPGERVISSLFPNRSYMNSWSGDLTSQVSHFKQWTYVAVHTICSRLAGLAPNMAYIYDESIPGRTVKACQRGLNSIMGKGMGGTGTVGSEYKYREKYLSEGGMWDYTNPESRSGYELGGWGGHSWLTMGEYRSKALSVVKPHEDLEPLENEHPLRRLFDNPNKTDTSFDFLYETQMFQELTGVSYTWVVPNPEGFPCELWCIPSHWVWPRTSGGREVSPDHPHAGELIEYYEVRPWGGNGGAGFLRFPPNEIIMERWKSPIDKINGYAKLTAGAQWIDTEESITRSRWSQFINQAMPGLWLELGSGYEDPDDNEIARIEAKFMARFQGEGNFGKPIITPPGAKVTPLGFSPTEMSYKDSEGEIRDMILSLFQVPKAAVGISEGLSYGSVLATLASMCSQCINPRLTMRGQTLTKHLASRWSKPGRRVKLWWDDTVPADPAQVNNDIITDIAAFAVVPNEVRALRGRASYKHGGNDPIVQGPGGPMPFPINTGEDIEDLAELIKPFAQPEQAEQQAEEGGPLELPPAVGNELAEEEVPEIEETESIFPEEPNGEPTKSVKKSTADAAVGDLATYLNELPDKYKDGLYVWVNEGPPSLAIVDFMDWFDGGSEVQNAIISQASKWTGDEQRVIVQNEGGKPSADWQQVFPDKYGDFSSKSVRKVAKGFTPVASGLAVMAYDTGRVLMLQRHIDDHRGGTWEFPGGKIEGDTDPLESAKREWYEETGINLPTGKLVDNWKGTNGKYQGFVYLVPKEDDVDIVNRRLDTNPDGDVFEVVAWVSPKDFDNHNLRPELLADLIHLQRATTLGKSLKYLCKHIPGRGAVAKSIIKIDKAPAPVEVAKKKEDPKKRAKRKAKGVKK